MLECIVSLPDNLFFNTPISTYILIVNNKKEPRRKGKIQLIDGSLQYNKMIMSLGEKRKYIDDSQKDKLLQTYIKFEESEYSKIFDNEFFGYTRVNIEQPIKENGVIKYKKDGTPKPDTNLRGYERIPLSEDIETFYSREVKPHLPDSWIDFSKNKVGYEIPFTKYFYREKPLRSSKKITYDLLGLDNEPLKLFKEVLNNQNIKRIRLENVVDLIKRPIKREDDKKYTKIGMYNWGRGIFKYPSELGSELGDSSFNFIKEGDLLLSGQFSWEGSVSMVGKEVDNCISSHRFHILKGKENILLNEYLWSYFRSQEGHFLLTENSFGSSGRNQPLNIGKLLKEKIPVPDISIQKEICRLVQQIISFDKYSKQRLGLLNEYRQSVITELLTGTRKVED